MASRASEDSIQTVVKKLFRHARKEHALPDGFIWHEQKRKYCQGDLWTLLRTHTYSDWHGISRHIGPHEERSRHLLIPQLNRNKFGYVFCHRGLYDHARGVPENSLLAVENGIREGFHFHELDGNLSIRPESTSVSESIFFAHDETPRRVSPKTLRWAFYKLDEIRRTTLVTRNFDKGKGTYANSYLNTTQKVPLLRDLDPIWRREVGEVVRGDEAGYVQFDLRGKDFADSLAHFYHQTDVSSPRLILKGYNSHFSTYEKLKAATEKSKLKKPRRASLYDTLQQYPYMAIIVFYSDPIIDLALEALKGKWFHLKKVDRYALTYENICDVFRTQLLSFYNAKEYCFILEIVFTGLGLGYNVQNGTARNPMDGTPLTDREVIFQSCVDRAMIDVGLELKKKNPSVFFSSCTRLCDIITPEGTEMTWNWKTGQMMIAPDGEQGLAKRLRSIHGGLYPQSYLVVADDPYAEVAARTWIDEHAQLDRSQLLHMTYNDWIEQGEKKVPGLVAAVQELNGPFLPNQVYGPLDDDFTLVHDDEDKRWRSWWGRLKAKFVNKEQKNGLWDWYSRS
jgi:hypothetical protein